MLVDLLDSGEWQIEGNEITVRVATSATVIEMSLGADAKRIATAAASGALGAPAKFKVVPGGTPPSADAPKKASRNGSGRSRAEQDPIVRKMQEKFGAEIRTIIDYKEKR